MRQGQGQGSPCGQIVSHLPPSFLSPPLHLFIYITNPIPLLLHLQLSMPMEVMISSPLDSACTTPYMSAPSSPKSIPAFYYSAPGSPSAVPTSDDFAFDFSGHLERASLPADQLFDGGKIKPLKPPPRFQYDHNKPLDSPKRFIREAFSPKIRPEIDPFAAALEHTRNDSVEDKGRRGRERVVSKSSRSLSPYRVSDLLFDNPDKPKDSSSFWYKKWKIKDLLLFRSASESRAKDKQEQLKKYAQLKKEVNNSSFRSTDSVGSRRRPVSAHELHYTVNRAFSEEMRKRTSLPYRQGFLGCLGFHPTLPEISKGLNLSRP